MKNLWEKLKRPVCARQPTNLTQFPSLSSEEWTKISAIYCGELVEGYQKCLTQDRQFKCNDIKCDVNLWLWRNWFSPYPVTFFFDKPNWPKKTKYVDTCTVWCPVQHIATGCKMLTGKEKMECHYRVVGLADRNICSEYGLEVPVSRWNTFPKVVEN